MTKAETTKNDKARGLQIFAQGRFWPVGLVEISMFQASVLVPDVMAPRQYDRVALKVGDMPSFPALVQSVDGDLVELEFLATAHPEILAILNGKEASARRRNPLRGLIAA